MNNTKWTPGPFYVDTAPWLGLNFGVLKDGEVIAACREVTPEADRHNANLFAASPELYETLESFERAVDLWLPEICQDMWEEEAKELHALREKILSVLAKARGEDA